MQLILNNGEKFTVTSFTESLSFRTEEEIGRKANIDLSINIAYYDSIEDLIPILKDNDFSSLEIIDGTGTEKRTYTDYMFNQVSQNFDDFHRVMAMIQLTKSIPLD